MIYCFYLLKLANNSTGYIYFHIAKLLLLSIVNNDGPLMAYNRNVYGQ